MNIKTLELELTDHPDTSWVQYLINGLKEGFDTGVHDPPTSSLVCPNLLSARKQPNIVSKILGDEVKKGYLLGPFREPPFTTFRCSPIGIVDKKYSEKKRLIVDLSSPRNDEDTPSINALICKEDYTLSYVKLDDAIAAIKHAGKGAQLCKTDIVDAFKIIPIHPTLWHLYGVYWDNFYYFFVRLAFGCRSSPKIFDMLSTAVCWIAQHQYGINIIFHLLNDFLTVDSPNATQTEPWPC